MQRVLLLIFILVAGDIYSQGPASIAGKWLKTSKEDLIIDVFKVGEEYRGKISWIKDSSKQKQVGFQILEGLKFDKNKNAWTGGKVHSPLSGATYKAIAKIGADGLLEVHAYKGLKFIGRKKYFKRVK